MAHSSDVQIPAPAVRSARRGKRWLALLLALLPAVAAAQDANECDVPGESPDLVVADLHQVQRFGTSNGITAFSVGTVSCNVGTCWADWISTSNQHPVIGQNMYRFKDGRFEQIGQSWLKHGFFALSQDFCSSGCVPSDGMHLGVNCSDPYSSGLNGDQTRLGPRSEVNAATGAFPFPFSTQGDTGNAIYKRLQVHNTDLDPALNPGASYFVEGQYVAADDVLSGNAANNNSYRPVDVTGAGNSFDISLTGSTVQQAAAVQAWAAQDPGVHGSSVQVINDGLFLVYSRATDLGSGMWHYEYAVQNLTSYRSAGSFEVPVPFGAQVQNIGFHDVDYHSGEPYDGTDWTGQVVTDPAGDVVSWSTTPFATDPDANALRWGTLYNFRFDADVPPVVSDVTLGLFVPETPASVAAEAHVPSPCNTPGEARSLQLSHDGTGGANLAWLPPTGQGSIALTYDLLRSPDEDFLGSGLCLTLSDPAVPEANDKDKPGSGGAFYYLPRALNECQDSGSLGVDSAGGEREGPACP